jgi:hypothetical protein
MIRIPPAAVLLALACTWTARAQESPAPGPQPEETLPTLEQAQINPAAGCVQPEPMVRWQDYKGPFAKTVGTLAERLERKSVHPPRFKAGTLLCSLTTRGKFMLFVHDSTDPVTFLGAAFNAGLDQAEDTDPTFGHDWAGYGKRFGAELANNSSSAFFKDFAYPAIFSEDPRYFRLARGSTHARLLHALGHVILAHRENGTYMFNFSEWLGTASAATLADTYHPGNRPGVGPVAENVALGIASDMGYDVLREFWPEIAKKFKLPFRGENEN